MAAWIKTGCFCVVMYSIDTVVGKKVSGAGQEAVLSGEDTVSIRSFASAATQLTWAAGAEALASRLAARPTE